ncbi:hypothetical protein F4678DRAFT_458995 [Xylaria arbuscula]|nr:hypothetical protein F4678DRAFT_458995 [Xylaria arbuscula]
MDPLSITTSVITLLGAANNIYNALKAIRNADGELQKLLREISTLTGYLRSIDKALEDCRCNTYALSHIDPALWKESKIALSDCQETINELSPVFKEPKRPSRSNTLFRRARVAAELRSRASDIKSFREKISMSNLSLQTLLQIINVSLSLRSNESHDNILRDLKELKELLKKSSQAATASYSTLFLNEQDTRLVHHLKGLIRAAHDFHTSASVTASTVAGSTQAPRSVYGDNDERLGTMHLVPSMKRKQIETYLSQNRPVARSTTSLSSVSCVSDQSSVRSVEEGEIVPSVPLKISEVVVETREIDSDHEFSTIFTSGFSKIAQRALQQLELEKADDLLRRALKWYSSSGSTDIQHQQRLQTQLALCTLLQGDIQQAQDLVRSLVNSGTVKDTVALQLLYALALLQLHELDFEGARENSKQLWAALQKNPQCTVLVANDAMRVLATSYQESGDSLLADAIEAELPDLNLSEPVPKMVDWLVDCKELLVEILGLQDCPEVSNSHSVVRKIHDLPISKNPSSLQLREQALGDAYFPVPTSPSMDADDELSVQTDSDFVDQPKAKKRSWSNLRALFRPRSTDLYPSSTGAQESTFKLRKIVKVSHMVLPTPQRPGSDRNASVPSIQSPMKSKWNSLTKRSQEVQKNVNSEGSSRTMEWIAGQTSNTPTNSSIENQDNIQEQKQRLQRQFSFQEGIPDQLREKKPIAIPTTYYEMPNNAIFELMDTSPTVKPPTQEHESYIHDYNNKDIPKHLFSIPKLDRSNDGSSSVLCLSDNSIRIPDIDFRWDRWDLIRQTDEVGVAVTTPTSLEMENDIYGLLGLDSSSGSDTEFSSDFDDVKQSTRQTSFDSSFLSAGRADPDSDTGESSLCSFSMQTKNGRDTESITSSESLSKPSLKATSRQIADPAQQSVDHPQTRTLSCETDNSTTKSQSPKSNSREFGPALARFYQHKVPHKAVFRRRLPVSTTAGLRKLFGSQNHSDKGEFDFGFNNGLYIGPDAIVGPFSYHTSRNTSKDSLTEKSLPTGSIKEVSVGEKRGPQLGQRRTSSLTRVQIDDYLQVSQEHSPFRGS